VRRERWAVRLRRQDNVTGGLWTPGPRTVVCSQHFHNSDFFWQWGRKLVKPDAEPTVFSFAPAVKRRKPPTDRKSGLVSCLTIKRRKAPADQKEDEVMNFAAFQQESVLVSDVGSSVAVARDHQYAMKSPQKMVNQLHSLVNRLHDRTSAVRNSRKRERRLRGKVADLLRRLKKLQLLHNETEELLDIHRDMPLHLLSGRRGRQFSGNQKQFAVTLHYYSPAAYHYVRRHFKLLPCSRTIRSWLTSFDGSPGLTEQSFDTITEKVSVNSAYAWSYKLCALHVDEMEIKKQIDVERSTGKVYGFTDIGSGTFQLSTLLEKNM